MTTLTQARDTLAAEIIAIVRSQIPVLKVPPTQLTAPSVVIAMGAAEQNGPGLWHQTFNVTVIATAGDNEAALQWVERVVYPLARGLSHTYAQPISWEEPDKRTNVGQTYLTCSFDVVVDVAP